MALATIRLSYWPVFTPTAEVSSEFAESVERRSAAEIDLKKLPLLLPKTKARSVKRESAPQRLVQRQKTFGCDARRHGGVGGWRRRTDTTSPPRCCSPAIPQRTSSRGTKRARTRVDGGGRRLEKNVRDKQFDRQTQTVSCNFTLP